MLDLHLTFAHHLLAFLLLALVVAEAVLLREGFGAKELNLTARIDLGYGVTALALLVAGASRVAFAAKGWEYYSHNVFFWAKMAVFAAMGAVSVVPTLRFTAWRRRYRSDAPSLPAAREISATRVFVWVELILFAFLPLFAAAMARGYGEFSR